MARVLLAGESWISQSTHFKGFDSFSSTTFETGADAFIAAAATEGIEIEQLYAHDVPERFPRTQEELAAYDVVILSDIGYNSFVLPPETWLSGQKSPNPLVELATWTRNGGGLMMAGGYLSFQGFQARANFVRSPIAPVLPVRMLEGDDRAEVPEGGRCTLVAADHPAVAGWTGEAPDLLGYNVVNARDEADVLAKVNDDVLVSAWQVEQGRSLVWTSDIGPHWCPEEFLGWDGFAPLVGSMLRWLAGDDA
jgi:uncharacterized membrane protein